MFLHRPWTLRECNTNGVRRQTRTGEAALVRLEEGLPRDRVVAAVKAGAAGVLPVPPEPEALRRLLDEIAGRAGLPRAKRAN